MIASLFLLLTPVQTFENTLSQLHDHLKSNQDVVDKYVLCDAILIVIRRIVTKLIVTYHTDKTQRHAVLEVMSGILNFTVGNVGLFTYCQGY